VKQTACVTRISPNEVNIESACMTRVPQDEVDVQTACRTQQIRLTPRAEAGYKPGMEGYVSRKMKANLGVRTWKVPPRRR
jgi:hypothetical protein